MASHTKKSKASDLGTSASQYAVSDMKVLVKSLTEAINSSQTARTTEPGTYDGTRDALKIDSWVRSVERYANFYGWNDARTKSYALTLLRGRAETWYRSLEVAKDEPANWLDFKRELMAFFRPDNSKRMARDRLCSY
ncbi:hypothetical protein G6F43_012490 [Rhizopus delemar]|nr:hypothetical protein G6F43_012490 [Rhizopus delemar]